MKKLFVVSLLFSFLSFAHEGTGKFQLSLSETLSHPGDYTEFSLESRVQCYQDRQAAGDALIELVKNAKDGIGGIFNGADYGYEIESRGFNLGYRNWGNYDDGRADPCKYTWEGSQTINIKIYEVGDEIINNILNNLYWLVKGFNKVQENGAIQYVEIGNPSKGLLASTIEDLTYVGERILREKALARFLNFIGDDYAGKYAITDISLGNLNSYARAESFSQSLSPLPPGAGDIGQVYVDLNDLTVDVSATITIWYDLKYYGSGEGYYYPGTPEAIPADPTFEIPE